MSDEIKVQASIQVDNGNFKFPKVGVAQIKIDQATAGGGNPGTILVGLTETELDLSELEALGWVYLKNLDASNSVVWGPKSENLGSGSEGSLDDGYMTSCGMMKAGEPALFRLDPDATLTLRAIGSPCRVLVAAFED
jgi:hypothetical protein